MNSITVKVSGLAGQISEPNKAIKVVYNIYTFKIIMNTETIMLHEYKEVVDLRFEVN